MTWPYGFSSGSRSSFIIEPTSESCTTKRLHLLTNMCLCIQVREACSILDLDVLFYPCPKDGPNWRPKVGLWAWPSGSAEECRVSSAYGMHRLDNTNVANSLPFTLPCVSLFGFQNFLLLGADACSSATLQQACFTAAGQLGCAR